MYRLFQKRTALACLLSVAPLIIGCGNIRLGLTTSRSLVAITVAPSPTLTTVGQNVPLSVTATYSDGSDAFLTTSVAWSVPSQMGTVTPSGVLRCSKPGTFAITATIDDVSSSTSVQCAGPSAEVALKIDPQPVSLSSSAPIQLQLFQLLPDGSQTDVTKMAQWVVRGTVASVDASGMLMCLKSGQDLVTAAYKGITIQDPVACNDILGIEATGTTGTQGATGSQGPSGTVGTTGSQGTTGTQGATGATGSQGSIGATQGTNELNGTLTLTLPGPRTPVGYTLTATLTDSATSGEQDVTSQASWSVTPVDHASISSGIITCVQAGDVTVTATFGSQMASSPLTCTPMNFHRATQFIEQGDEFSGPFDNWLNVKQIGAIGDGVADDTQAIQNGLNALVPDTAGIRVLYLPPGTYRITNTLSLVQTSFVNVVGADPATTKVIWDGAVGGTLFDLNGSAVVRLTRLTFDGASKAAFAVTLDRSTVGGQYSTALQLSDLHLVGVATGLNLQITAETDIERIFFDGNTEECIHLGDANNINIFIRDSLFSHCGVGISNYQGAGVFNVSDSFFDHSVVADMHIQNTGFFAARRNTSIGSGAFFRSELIGANNAQITLQGNTVIDPTSTPVVLGNTGPLTLIDNTFRMLDQNAPVLTGYDGRSPSDPVTQASAAFSFGNIYSTAHPVGSFDGNVVAYDDTTVDASSIPTPSLPSNVYIPPVLGRQVFEVPSNSTDVEIQAAIDAATASHQVKPIVHLPQSGYTISNPLIFPSGSDIQLVGDGLNITKLYWRGPAAGSVVSLPSTHTKLSNLTITTFEYQYGDHVPPAAGALDGLLYSVDDQPSDRIIADQLQLEGGERTVLLLRRPGTCNDQSL